MGDVLNGFLTRPVTRQQCREKILRGLDALHAMLRDGSFDNRTGMSGMELELNLVAADGQPAFVNGQVLAQVGGGQLCAELGRFNVELNLPPLSLVGAAWGGMEELLVRELRTINSAAARCGAQVATIGIMPTLMTEHLNGRWMSDAARYAALNESILAARGEDLLIDISGVERLSMYSESVGPEAACTSSQLHLQVAPEDFAAYWNAAQLFAAPQVALAANSPWLFGRQLWQETRIELFKQATDTRPQELRNQGVRPRVFFGERWISSSYDLFEENSQFFPALLSRITTQDPLRALADGVVPHLAELCLHNGTIYRWNRPVYDSSGSAPHLRIENRVLAAGPSVTDIVADALFYYGVVRSLATDPDPLWQHVSFQTATQNFLVGARQGMGAQLYWPGVAEVSVQELVLRELLPRAYAGLESWGVPGDVAHKYLSVIEGRAKCRQNGATWQCAVVSELTRQGVPRVQALTEMFVRYQKLMATNRPVHTWPVAEPRSVILPRQKSSGCDVVVTRTDRTAHRTTS